MINAKATAQQSLADDEPPFTAYYSDKTARGIQADCLEKAVIAAERLGDVVCVTVTGEAMPITSFEDDVITEEFERRFGDDMIDATAVRRAYRLMAEGERKLAMEELERAYDLPPAHHERAIADLLARARA